MQRKGARVVIVFVNGKEQILPGPMTVEEFLSFRGLEAALVVIEINLGIVKREQWAVHVIAENDRLEILRFVGGG
ncbi:MAG TPA: sulfur carrier protein ThiS [Candidatus Limnocylindrales bacterium]|nr:sulfur carrier protein ThiS [Candidatus Limnocylindrales bacterium]